MPTSSQSRSTNSNSSFFARVKNKSYSSARLGLTALGVLTLAIAVSASSSKPADKSKKSAGIDAALSGRPVASSAQLAASNTQAQSQQKPLPDSPSGCVPCPFYTTATSQDVIVMGTTDIGNHCDDCTTDIALPFPVTLYGTTYPTGTLVHASSNGSLEFGAATSPFGTSCPLPDSRINRAILAYQGDLRTDNLTGAGEGIFVVVNGTAPNRTFYVEWRTEHYSDGSPANFEIVLHENTNCFDVIYGVTSDNGSAEESGVQKSAAGPAVQFSCLAATLTPALKVTYCPNNCPVPVPTSAVSRKIHGGAGTFDINLPLVPLGGPVGIEDRQQGAAGLGTLYDQTSSPGANATSSQNFEAANDGFDDVLADDFVVPAGGWVIGGIDVGGVYFNGPGPASSVNVIFYVDSATLPGAPVAGGTYMSVPIATDAAGSFHIVLPSNLALAPGTYWVSVQANQDFTPAGQWGWTDRTVQSNSGAAWENPNGGFATACTPSWGRKTTCVPTPDPDQIFRLLGPGLGGFNHQIVVTFPAAVTVDSVAVTAGTGNVGSFTVAGNVVTVNLTDVTNAQRLGVTLVNVCDGTNSGDILIPMGVLAADSTGNGSTNAGDISQIRQRSGVAVSGANFRSDCTANGSINAGDISLARQKTGTALPP